MCPTRGRADVTGRDGRSREAVQAPVAVSARALDRASAPGLASAAEQATAKVASARAWAVRADRVAGPGTGEGTGGGDGAGGVGGVVIVATLRGSRCRPARNTRVRPPDHGDATP